MVDLIGCTVLKRLAEKANFDWTIRAHPEFSVRNDWGSSTQLFDTANSGFVEDVLPKFDAVISDSSFVLIEGVFRNCLAVSIRGLVKQNDYSLLQPEDGMPFILYPQSEKELLDILVRNPAGLYSSLEEQKAKILDWYKPFDPSVLAKMLE